MNQARLKVLVLGTTAVVLVAIGLLVGRILSRGEGIAVATAQDIVTRSADIAESLLNRHLLQVEGQLASLGELLSQGFLDGEDAVPTSHVLREMTVHSFTYRNLILARLDGIVWASAVEARRDRPISIPADRLLTDFRTESAVIFGPVPHPQSGELMLVMIRRIPAGAGRPDLLAAAEIPTALITSALAPMANPSALRIRLERIDGMVLAAGPGQEMLEGTRLAEPALLIERQSSVVRSRDRQGEGMVFATARAIFYPGLITVAVLPEEAAIGDWLQIRRRVIAGAVAIMALVAAFGTALFMVLSARQRAAMDREAASRRLNDAVERLPDGFVLWDAEDRLVVCNSRYRALMGLGGDVLVPGFRFEELVRFGIQRGLFRSRSSVSIERRVARALQSHKLPRGVFERELSDGRWLRIAQQRMPDGGIVVILAEITAARQTMTALAEARDGADRATAAKSRLLAHISHELRTPLAGLLRLAERLGGADSLSATQSRQVTLVGSTARHLLALANEVLDLASMEAGKLQLNLGPMAPVTVLEDALAMVQPLAEAKDVQLSFMPEGLPAWIEADATRIRQMVLNLLANAVKFTPAGSLVRLDATVHSSPPLLRIEVADQGPGVPETERGRLFTDFTRLAPNQTEGTGLGLSITARLTALMGGRIGYADARGGTGACFWIELPLVLAAEEADGAEDGSPSAPFDAERRLRLLAVDDVAANLAVLQALLAPTGFELETAGDGAAALEAVARAAQACRPFDALLMDVMMPGMDGIEATRRLRALPDGIGQMPVIALTAGAFPEDVAACRAAGMVAHLSKPVQRPQLLGILAEILRAASPHSSGPDGLGALRPLLLAELRRRLDQLDASGMDKAAQLEAMQAVVGTAGHLDRPELVAAARGVLKALRDDDPEAPTLLRRLPLVFREAFPALAAADAA
ncbi:hybrid sensor histidine kinase/response regulator [Roseococcus pinisoli]|uniref:histidine kinase n=1 Tax=Roseococcus pinisoli TaxID=2835040 RepID=A0ABS5QGP3_9PROT|nr:PAS-domain containing protein [Roseococcus pinisoli]MBS7812120.1 PAS-domain containing protein [Roseococcus pinisoli]